MSAKFRVGVIASGRIARSHGRGWSQCEHTEIAAVADTHPEALASYAEDFGIESRYHDYREMLDKEDLDIVSVCSWDPQHAEMTIAACARKPRAVLCEKPMAVSLGEAEAMIVAAERNDVKLAIGHQRRFYPRWREARRLIADGAIGRPQRLWSSVRSGLMNTGTHCLDCQLFVLGDPRAEWVMGAVERHTDHYIFGHRVEDRCAGIIGYPGGAEGVIENEMNDANLVGAAIYGEEGMMVVDDDSLQLMTAATGGWKETGPGGQAGAGNSDAFAEQANGICRWIDGEFDDYPGKAEYGKAATEIMMALYESARLHERVIVPVQTRANPLDVAVEEGVIPVTRPGAWDERSFLVRGESMSWNGRRI